MIGNARKNAHGLDGSKINEPLSWLIQNRIFLTRQALIIIIINYWPLVKMLG